MSSKRPLLAGHLSHHSAAPSSSSTTESLGGERSQGGRPKRSLVDNACLACRKRKSKCDGLRPKCTSCQSKATECEYEAEEGESRQRALRRKIASLNASLEEVKELLSFVQARPEGEAQEIFQRIRASNFDDLFNILRQAKDGDFVDQPARTMHRLPPIRSIVDLPAYPGMQSTESLMAPGVSLTGDEGRPVAGKDNFPASFLRPEFNVHAAFWTKVTSSDQLVSHLLSVYFKSDHSIHNFFDKDLFLQDLVSRRTVFCSSLLVNAILAIACTYSPLTRDAVEPWKNGSIHMAFHKESVRLWTLEQMRDTLTTMQAAYLITYEYNKMGQDKIGLSYQVHGLRMANSMGLFRVSPRIAAARTPRGVTVEDWERARAVSAWGSYNYQVLTSFCFQSSPLLGRQPPIPIPRYAQQNQDPAIFEAFCHLSVIQNDICTALYGVAGALSGYHPSPEQTEIHFQSLLSFHNSLPAALNIDQDAYNDGERLVLHMTYYCIVLRLFKPFLNAHSSTIERTVQYQERARDVSNNAARHLWGLLVQYRQKYNFTTCPVVLLQFMAIGAYSALDDLALGPESSMDLQEVEQAFIVCIRGLRTLGDSIYFAQPVLRTISMTVRNLPHHVDLSQEADTILSSYDTEDWINNAAKHVHSQYAADWRTNQDLDSIRLDNLIQEWKDNMVSESHGSEDETMSTS